MRVRMIDFVLGGLWWFCVAVLSLIFAGSLAYIVTKMTAVGWNSGLKYYADLEEEEKEENLKGEQNGKKK